MPQHRVLSLQRLCQNPLSLLHLRLLCFSLLLPQIHTAPLRHKRPQVLAHTLQTLLNKFLLPLANKLNQFPLLLPSRRQDPELQIRERELPLPLGNIVSEATSICQGPIVGAD